MTIPNFTAKSTAYDFAVTLTLNPRLNRITSQKQFDLTVDTVKRFCLSFQKASIFAELTKKMNIHYHLIVQPKTPMSLLQFQYWIKNRIKDKYSETLGFSVEKLVFDYSGWVSYITEDIKDSTALLNRDVIIRDDYNLIKPSIKPRRMLLQEPCVQHKEDTSSLGEERSSEAICSTSKTLEQSYEEELYDFLESKKGIKNYYQYIVDFF